MRNVWSISESLYVYYSIDNTSVCIANPEKKVYWRPVKKISCSKRDPEIIKNDGLKIKFESGKVKVELSGKYYNLLNYTTDYIVDQLSSVNIENGEVSDTKFGFNPEFPEKTILLFPGSEIYKDSEKEFIRRINLSLYTKTTKYKVGHRYESENGTYLYLGKAYLHVSNNMNRSKYCIKDSSLYDLFTDDFDTNSKIEDIIRDYKLSNKANFLGSNFEKSIYFLNKKKSMADLGSCIAPPNDSWKIEDVWEERVSNFMRDNREPYTYGSEYFSYKGFSSLLKSFFISSCESPKVTETTESMMEEILRTQLTYVLFQYSESAGIASLKNSSSLEDYVVSAKSAFKTTIFSLTENYLWMDLLSDMYSKLFSKSVEAIFKDTCKKYKLYTVPDSTFNDLINNFLSYKYKNNNYNLNLDFLYCKNTSFEEYLGDGFYSNVIKDIYKEAIETNGANLKSFSLVNIGSSTRPCILYTMSITLEDIQNHFGVDSIYDIPDQLKDELMEKKIYSIYIKTREDIKIKL